MLHPRSTNIVGHRPLSPKVCRPDFRDGSRIEERDRHGELVARYRCGKLLGRGGFAKCYDVLDIDSNRSLACKVIDRHSLSKPKTLQKLHSEIAIHRRMKHPNIVAFEKTFQDEWFVYILLEKCANQTLMEISKTRSRFSVSETQHILLQAIGAVQYMHQEGVIHRDLKLGNMMMDAEMNVKLGDFGLAAELTFDGERKRTICGTPNYIAPEILEGSRDGHSFEADVWSLGVILYTLLVGEPPFQTADVKTTYSRIKLCRYSFPPNVPVSETARDLIHQMLQSCPEKRPSLVQIRMHPFFMTPAPPSLAPLTLFSEGQRQRMEQIRREKQREPIIWNGNAALGPAVISPPTAVIASAVAPASAINRMAPTTRDFHARATGSANAPRTRTNSVPSKPLVAPSLHAAWPETAPKHGRAPSPKVEEDEDRAHLTEVHEQLHQTFHGTKPPLCETAPAAATPPTVWVTEYADYSSKYGLAYRLNTGHTAVHFNDSTKMVWEPITNRVEYYARIREDVNGVVHAQDQRHAFHMDTFPDALNKKVTLIKYFKGYLTRSRGKKDGVEVVACSPYVSTTAPMLTDSHMVSEMIYVKRWVITRQAIIFRLSNKTIQVCFSDHTEVILSSESKVVTYTDAQGHRVTVPLATVPSTNEELASRLHYTKEMLCKLISNRNL